MKTLDPEFNIQDDFPPVDYEQWRALAEQAIHGASFDRKLVTHTYEGIDVQPIYTRADQVGDGDALGFPGLAPFVRGSRPLGSAIHGWDVRAEHAHPDLATTHQAILDDLNGGATSVLIQLDRTVCQGLDPDHESGSQVRGRDGVLAFSVDDFELALADVNLNDVAVALEAGAAFLPAAATLIGLWRRRGVSTQARGALNADPLATLARTGQLPVSPQQALSQMADLASWTDQYAPLVTAVGVDTSPYHDAGATSAQDIAFALATAVEYLRAMDLEIDRAARQIVFRMGLGTHHFLAIAKLRAARQLWSRVIQACGGSDAAGAMRIHARTSNRVMTRRDPYVNLLRNAVAVFAAGVGGADAITSVPFDVMIGLPDEFSRRVARNSVHVLQHEAHLHRVVDPAGGSWFLDSLTEQLAQQAWTAFQEIERQGGMLATLQSGWIGAQIDAAYAPRAKDIARRKQGITGVSEFPNVDESRVTSPPVDADALRAAAGARVATQRQDDHHATLTNVASAARVSALIDEAAAGATIGQLARALEFHTAPSEQIPALEPHSFAEPFEALRDASDAWRETHGQAPRVFLANLGPIAHHTARATYAKNFFEAGGFDVVTNDGFSDADQAAAAFAESGARIAVVCSSDRLYPDMVPDAAAKLKSAGARTVVLAGHPGENRATWQAAGVDRFIYISCDVLDTLQQLLHEEGVIEAHEE